MEVVPCHLQTRFVESFQQKVRGLVAHERGSPTDIQRRFTVEVLLKESSRVVQIQSLQDIYTSSLGARNVQGVVQLAVRDHDALQVGKQDEINEIQILGFVTERNRERRGASHRRPKPLGGRPW